MAPWLLAVLGAAGGCSDAPELVLPYDPTPVEASIPTVVQSLRTGDPERALAELDRLAEQGVLPEGTGHYRALALADAGRTDEALAAWRAEVAAHPGNGRAHCLLADLLVDVGDLDGAREHLAAARRHAPDLPALSLVSGRLALLTLDDESAQRHYRDYLTADPYSVHAASAHDALAQIAARRGELPAAEAHSRAADHLEEVHGYLARFRQRLAEDGADVEARFGVAAAYLSLYSELGGDPRLLAEAESALTGVLALQPDHPRALFDMGFVRTMQGRDVEAIEHYRRALALEPDHVAARVNLARVLLRNGETAEPVALLESVVAGGSDALETARAHALLGELLADQGRRDEAIAHLQAYLALFPDDPQRLGGLLETLRGTPAAGGG